MANEPPSEAFRSLLATYASNNDYSLFSGLMPDSPDKAIVIADTGGSPANPKWLLDFPTVQVRVRGPVGTYLETNKHAKAVKDLLLGVSSQDINGDRYVSINLLSDTQFIGQDQNKRPEFSTNFDLIVEPAASSETNRQPLA